MNNPHELTIKSPVRSPKLNREALKKIHSSPQLKNILRQKWQQRMKEKRSTSFNHRRFCSDQEQELLDDAFSTQMYEMMEQALNTTISQVANEEDSDVDWEDWFQKKSAEEEEQLMMSEYDDFQMFEELMDSYMTESLSDSSFTQVICPMCQKNRMTEECGNICCYNCKFFLPAKMCLADFSTCINHQSSLHSETCNGCPTFISTPENNTISLYLTCDICSCCLLIM